MEPVETPLDYDGVTLSQLGRKNYLKLRNPWSKRVLAPPRKMCKKPGCLFMDWRTTGQIQKMRGKHHWRVRICVSSTKIGVLPTNRGRNGSTKHYEQLRKNYARKRGCPNAAVSMVDWLIEHDDDLVAILGENAVRILQDDDLVVWDTESDGVGGTHDLALTREWGFRRMKTGTPISNSASLILWHTACLIAFEPGSCDQNHLEHLPAAFHALRDRFVDFRRDIFNHMFTTDFNNKSRFYLTDGGQNTIWVMSGIDQLDDDFKEEIGVIRVPELNKGNSNKCEVDVAVLTNLYLTLSYFIGTLE
ncbi:hypothetical protein BDR26DRAFT_997368 [Obelidium mucronatum]|nr:hypothetical protein BDR26DRAFT_997368 [Obelidium mucronatum]